MPVESDQLFLTEQRCRELFSIVQQAARSLGVSEIEAIFGAHRDALTRFANNSIHQNVAEQTQWLSVRPSLDHRTARASTNRLDPASIRAAVEQAVALAKSAAADQDLLPLAQPVPIPRVDRFDMRTAAASPEDRARAVAGAIRVVEGAGQTAAGIYSTGETIEAILNSAGVAVWHSETLAQFSITAMAKDSSGWAKASAVSSANIDASGLARCASEKARLSENPQEIPPGRYTVVLEPAAVLDLVGQMFSDFSATSLRDQRSFLTDRLGTKLFGENIHIHDDVAHPLQAGVPFDGEGVPRKRLALVEAGVPREVAYSRSSAARAGVAPTGHGFPLPNEVGESPLNIVIAGGSTSVDEMVASTERGVLVTRLWYIREVDPYEKIMTGMTRDGTFLIENGRVVSGLKNFRFNQGMIELLNSVQAFSPTERASGEEIFDMVVPAMKVRDFHFTEVTRFLKTRSGIRHGHVRAVRGCPGDGNHHRVRALGDLGNDEVHLIQPHRSGRQADVCDLRRWPAHRPTVDHRCKFAVTRRESARRRRASRKFAGGIHRSSAREVRHHFIAHGSRVGSGIHAAILIHDHRAIVAVDAEARAGRRNIDGRGVAGRGAIFHDHGRHGPGGNIPGHLRIDLAGVDVVQRRGLSVRLGAGDYRHGSGPKRVRQRNRAGLRLAGR